MRRGELKLEWRGKVNPLFVLVIQYGRFMLRLFKELKLEDSDIRGRAPVILAQLCKETIPLLPLGPREGPRIEEELISRLKGTGEDNWLIAPETREPLAEIMTRIRCTPEAVLRKGLDKPHWWMTQSSLPHVVQKKYFVENFLNVLAALHFKMPLRDMKQHVIRGDLHLLADLFHFDRKVLQAPHLDVLKDVTDEVTKILGNALLLRKDPPGHQSNLRMILFFGWDFGLRDLSNDELYAFLNEIHLVPSSYDPETLRKYRNRLRHLIRRVSQRA